MGKETVTYDNLSYFSEAKLSAIACGQFNNLTVKDTALHTGNWQFIMILEETVFTILTDANDTATNDTVIDIVYLAGITLAGSFTQLQLQYGAVKLFGGEI